jgi:hypothetical protein
MLFVSDDEIPRTMLKDHFVISKDMLIEERSKKVGSSAQCIYNGYQTVELRYMQRNLFADLVHEK